MNCDGILSVNFGCVVVVFYSVVNYMKRITITFECVDKFTQVILKSNFSVIYFACSVNQSSCQTNFIDEESETKKIDEQACVGYLWKTDVLHVLDVLVNNTSRNGSLPFSSFS